MELPTSGLLASQIFLNARGSGLPLAERLLRVLFLLLHPSSADVKSVATHGPVVNLSRRDSAFNYMFVKLYIYMIRYNIYVYIYICINIYTSYTYTNAAPLRIME